MIPHNRQDGCDHRKAQVLERMWRNHLIYTVLVVQPLRKTVWQFLQKLKTELTYNHQHHCWVFIQELRSGPQSLAYTLNRPSLCLPDCSQATRPQAQMPDREKKMASGRLTISIYKTGSCV